MISDGISFTWETVFSHPSRLEIMKHAKKNGYKIHLTYVTTKHPDIMSIVFGVVYCKGGMMFQRRKLEVKYRLSHTAFSTQYQSK